MITLQLTNVEARVLLRLIAEANDSQTGRLSKLDTQTGTWVAERLLNLLPETPAVAERLAQAAEALPMPKPKRRRRSSESFTAFNPQGGGAAAAGLGRRR